jgi:hypothetical protein
VSVVLIAVLPRSRGASVRGKTRHLVNSRISKDRSASIANRQLSIYVVIDTM